MRKMNTSFNRAIAHVLLFALTANTITLSAQTQRTSRPPVVKPAAALRELPFFGPQKYVRTTGPKDVYTATINVPPWLTSPFRLHVDNGNANGTNRVSSGTVNINGTDVLTQSDFNQNAAGFDRTVTLTPPTTLTVTLASAPASFLTINLFGTSADYTAPVLTWSEPAPGSTVKTATPRVVIRYSDPRGTSEPAAAGVDLDTLKVSVDDVDRTALFARFSDQASAPIPLAPGRHTFKASISDLAGNPSETSGEFYIDVLPPTISIVEPLAGSYWATRNPAIHVHYEDHERGVNLSSLRVTLNDSDVTSLFVKGGADATIAWPAGMLLPEGLNRLTAKIQDLGGNEATANVAFSVDVKAPIVTIAQPANTFRYGSRDLGVTITWSDDQALAINPATATIDSTAVTLTTTGNQATGQLTALADGLHTLSAHVVDRAGNIGAASSTFTVDTSVPKIEILEPPNGKNQKTNTPPIIITYSDEQGVDLDTFKATINSIDRTNLFVKSNASAAPMIGGYTLPEGPNKIEAEIQDVTKNLGRAISSFFVDTVQPTGTIDAPADRVITATPVATVHYADSGSGIDPTSVRLFVDTADRSSLLTSTSTAASATLLPLSDGTHEVRFTFGDQTGNLTTLSKTFVVDTHAPQLTIVAPANDAFINASVPALRITYSDVAGTGVDLSSFRLTLQKSSETPIDVTSYVTVGPLEATGIVPDASKLTDGTYHLHARILDIAGNISEADNAFEIDTVAPTFRVESPAPNGYVATTTPQFTIRYDDELSGVDTPRAVVLIDGVNKTARFTFADGVATGTLLANEALAQGRHTIDVTLFDRAGNPAASAPQSFTVDTIAPTASIEAPVTGSFVGKAPHNFAVTYADGTGSGVDPASVKVTIDGIDRTAEFVVGPLRATASIATQLADGSHTLVVTVLDWAGNAATAASTFTADATKPVVTITSPAAGVWLKGPNIAVTGTIADNSPVMVEVNGLMAGLATGTFSTSVPAADGVFVIHVVARDAAGNVGTAEVTINVDSLAPRITVTEPAAPLFTKNNTAHLAGSIADASAVTLTLNGQPLALSGNAFATDVSLTTEGANVFTLVAVDAAANSSTSAVTITRDTIAPLVTVASPLKSSVIGTVPVVVSGTFSDATAVTITVDGVAATLTGSAWQASISGLVEGLHLFAVVATDAAGNSTTVPHDVTIDLNAPLVTILTPISPALTKEATATITGTATDVSLLSVKASGIDATLTAGATPDEKKFTVAGVPLIEGDNTVHVVATDAISRTTDKTILVTRDSTLPVISVVGPDFVTRSHAAHLIATATDNLLVKDVAFLLGATELARLTTSPYVYDFSAPLTASIGDTLSLTITATDTAGNTASITKPIRFVAEGAITGQVLSDVDGRPIAGAHVVMTGSDTKDTNTDSRGRYAFPVNDQNVVLTIGSATTTTIERVVAINSGVGTVPVDARLTPLGPRVVISSAGGSLIAGNVNVSVPAGAVSTATGMRLTLLSPQGLPNLLPLGWSPVAAFNVLVEGTLAAPLPFNATIAPITAPVTHLAFYKTATHAWTMSQAGVTSSGGSMHVVLPEPGTYALVVTDDNSIPIAAAGELLQGVAMKPIPDTATSTGSVTPPTLPPSGGSAVGNLVVKSATPLPSGTVVQAEITETFTLSSGETASEEKRTEDLVLNRSGADVVASFPIVPSRSFTTADLIEGTVHLDILAGREAVRGKTGGGNQAVTLTGNTVDVTVPAGSLANDVAISATPAILSSFLPSSDRVGPFAEVVLDFSGYTLASSAQLSASAASLSINDSVVIARVERLQGIPRVVVVAGADRVGDKVVSHDISGFAGIRTGGRYAFYRVGVPWSIVSGTVALSFGASQAVVQVDGLPFVGLTNAQGQYITIAPVGVARLTASVPGTSLGGTINVTVIAGQTAIASFGLASASTTATTNPANGELHVPVSVQVEITATAPLDPNSANIGTIQLRKATSGVQVVTSYVFSGTRRVLAVVPSTSLDPGETYNLTVNGLVDVYGGVVSVAPVSFTTQPDVPPNYDTNKVVFTMPDANGLVTVSAPAGALPPGTRIIIVNSGNGVVVSFTAGNDGSFSGQFPATIDDRILVTITDPKGNVVSFERSKYVFTDGSGRVAIGSAGGTVEGPGGVALIIPDGALASGAIFKVEPFGPEKYPERPDFPAAHFGSGLTITSEQKPTLSKEGKLQFPKPADAPDGAFYYVFKRMTGPNGMVGFETIDYAMPDNNGHVVTASYPFIGWNDSVDSWTWTAEMEGVGFGIGSTITMVLLWSFDALLPATSLSGAIAGKVLRPVFKAGSSEPEFEGVPGAMVVRARENGLQVFPTFAVSGPDGTFSIHDPHYTGGTVQVIAAAGGDTVTATAFEANPLDKQTITQTLFLHHRHVANVNLTFPPKSQPPPAADIEVHLMTLDGTGKRHDVSGVAVANQPLLIGFKVNNGISIDVRGATIGLESLSVKKDQPPTGETLTMDWVSSQPWIPTAAGSYTLHAAAFNVLGGTAVDVDHTFLVVASAGGTIVNNPNAAPDWITARLVPRMNEFAVPLDALPQVVFTEPVTNVLGAVTLSDGTGNASIKISAIAVDAQGNQFAVADLTSVSPMTPVVSITVQPTGGLNLNSHYSLALTGAIQDLDTPTPKHFPGRTLTFTTIAGAPLASADGGVSASRMVILGPNAYVAERNPAQLNTAVSVWSLNDPSAPKLVTRIYGSGQTMDVSGEEHSVLNENGATLFFGSGMKFTVPGPSNVYLFDVRNPGAPKRIAAVSLTENAQQGTVLRVSLHGRFGYTITYPHGIQVIDLQKAIAIHQAADATQATRDDRARMLTIEGTGFAQDAVVNSIPISTINGQPNHVLDIDEDEYIAGGLSHTYVIGTGTLPLLVVDPANVGSSALKVTSLPGSMAGSLKTGYALALATISDKKLAVIGGIGTPAGGGEGPMVGVVDLTNPLSPSLIGAIKVNDTVTDVIVNNQRALVATLGSTYVFSLSDPAHPRLLGKIENTGGRIAMDVNGGVLLGNTRDGSSENGIHTAVFHPLLLIDRVEPLLTAPDSSAEPTPANPQRVRIIEQDAKKRTVSVRALPAGIAKTAHLKIVNRLFPDQEGTAKTPATVADVDVAINQNTGIGTFVLSQSQPYEDTDLLATATADTSTGGHLTSLPRTISLGWVKLTVDSNNNSVIDDDDREAARRGRPFGFWESDQTYALKTVKNYSDIKVPDDDPLKGLADYFTVRITVNKPWNIDSPHGSVRLNLGPTDSDAKPIWYIVRKVDPGKDYLSDHGAANVQVSEIVGTSDDIPPCSPLNGKLIAATTECQAQGESFVLLPPELVVGDHEFLVRCSNCQNRGTTITKQTPKMWLDYTPEGGIDPAVIIDESRVEIRPVRQWLTYMSARPSIFAPEHFKPLPELDGASRPESAEYSDKFEPKEPEQRTWANAFDTFGIDTYTPKKARDITVIVHGYTVNDNDMRNKYLPTVFKRLYWAGHPLMRTQGEWRKTDDVSDGSCVKNCAHTVGISWPGNYGGAEPNETILGTKAHEALAAFLLPEDEYRAFATGPALAKYLKKVYAENPSTRKIRILAHSLGNLLVNGALTRPELKDGKFIDRYIMNEAALPAEAMRADYDPDSLNLFGENHAALYGYPDDDPWQKDWSWMGITGLRLLWNNYVSYMRDNQNPGGALPSSDVLYFTRWTQQRPSTGVPDLDGPVIGARGPWRGIFDKNRERVDRLFNTYSHDDQLLTVSWRVNQLEFKPRNRADRLLLERGLRVTLRQGLIEVLPWRSADNPVSQIWSLLEGTEPRWDSVFGDSGHHWTLKRQWAELAYWFPSLSVAAGTTDKLKSLTADCQAEPCNPDFTKYSMLGPQPVYSGGALDQANTSRKHAHTHSYLGYGQFFDVYPAYQELRKMFDPKN